MTRFERAVIAVGTGVAFGIQLLGGVFDGLAGWIMDRVDAYAARLEASDGSEAAQ